METNRNQEWFNQIYLGLKKQEWKQSISDKGVCLYRGPNNCRCGVGQIIPDHASIISEERDASSGGTGVNYLHNYGRLHFLGLGEISSNELHFLMQVQRAHDQDIVPSKDKTLKEQMKDRFIRLASNFNLTIPEIIQ